jgi:hypothetical protein
MPAKMNKLYFFFFLLVVILVYSGMHYYVYIRIARGLEFSPRSALYLKILFTLSGAAFFIGEIIRRAQHGHFISSFAAIWLGLLAVSFSLFLLRDLAGLFWPPANSRPALLVALGLVLLLSGYSLFNAARVPRIRELKIQLDKLPPELSGFTIVQLSDLHLISTKSARWLEKIVIEANSCNPDLIVITGDFLDEKLSDLDGFADILGRLKSKNGVVAVTGNHEFYSGIGNFMDAANQLGVIVLMNQNITIAEGAIHLAGLDDRQGKQFGGSGAGLDTALNGVSPDKPLILLSHRPNIFDQAARKGVDLMLAGHTHAGQIPPMDLIVWLYYKYPYGLYRQNNSWLYTTSGVGTWGPPMRLFSRPEIAKIVLTR